MWTEQVCAMEGSAIQNVSWDRQRRALMRKAGIPVQTLGSSGRQLSREVTWSDTGLRKVRLACKSTTVKCPLPPSPRPLKAPQAHGPTLAWLTPRNVPGPTPGLYLPLPSFLPTLHTSQQSPPCYLSRSGSAAGWAPGSGIQPGMSPGSGQACPQNFLL